MAKRGSVTETNDQRLKAEFARRKNRRASFTEQFVVPVAKSKAKEERAQASHYEFLLQPENHAAIEAIVCHVRRLAESEALALGHVLSPMDKHRLHSWANEVLDLLAKFEPSNDRENDPLVRLLEQLQALQAGHVCLAEVAIEARQVVEKWERTGIFDDAQSSEDEDDKDDGSGQVSDMRSPQQRALDWEKRKRLKMEASYAYSRIRERAAAHVIKRNTLRWVRSRAAFCSRVEELEVFGNTTAALVEELTTVSDLQRRAAVSSASKNNDIYDLVRGKKGISGGHKIDFSDLMHFSKHLALFTVDHALRRIGEIEQKRRLYQLRCLIKLQTWWRKMHEIVKGRRMLRLLEEVRRKKEEERAAELLRVKEGKSKPAKSSDTKKTAKAGGKSDKSGSSGADSNPGASSRSISSQKAATDSSTRSLNTKSTHRGASGTKDAKSVVPTPPSTPKTSTISSGGGANRQKRPSVAVTKDDKGEQRVSRARAREARLRKEFEDEMRRRKQEDEEAARDTGDVEQAWKRFIESAQGNKEADESDGEDCKSRASSLAGDEIETRSATPYAGDEIEDAGMEEWKEWSDDEDHTLSDRERTPSSSAVSSRLSTPRSNGVASRPPSNEAPRPEQSRRPVPPSQVVASMKKRATSRRIKPTPPATAECARDDNDSKESPPYEPSTGVDLVLPYAAAPSPSRRQLLFGTSQARQSRPALPGTGQLSKFMPFAEFSTEPTRLRTPTSSTLVTPRCHLHEIDFSQPQLADASATVDMLMLSQPLVDDAPITEDTSAIDANANQPVRSPLVNPVRVFSSVRANRVARIRAALQAKGSELQPTSMASETVQSKVETDAPLMAEMPQTTSRTIGLEALMFVNNDVREALLRPIRGRASVVEAYISNPMLKLDFRMEDVMRKPEEPQAAPKEGVAAPEVVFADMSTATPSKAKFGSHADWLHTMGLENASKMAARSSTGAPATSIRPHKKKEIQVQQQLATSMLSIQENTSSRAKQKRKKEHALPLLGRRSPNQQATTPATPIEEKQSAPLPPVERRHSKASPPKVPSQRARRRKTQHQAEPMLSDPSDMDESMSDESVDAAIESSGDSDAESSRASDSSEDNSVGSSKKSEQEYDDPAVESDSNGEDGVEVSDSLEHEADSSTAVAGVPGRKSSRRVRRSVRPSNQRRRSSLHEPKHKKERKSPKKKIKKRTQANSVDTADDDEDSDHSPTEEQSEQEKRRRHFRKRTSLLQKLVPKGKRTSTATRHLNAAEDDNEPKHGDESCASEVSDEADSPDPEKAAAFFKLYSQYMGLVNAAPRISGRA